MVFMIIYYYLQMENMMCRLGPWCLVVNHLIMKLIVFNNRWIYWGHHNMVSGDTNTRSLEYMEMLLKVQRKWDFFSLSHVDVYSNIIFASKIICYSIDTLVLGTNYLIICIMEQDLWLMCVTWQQIIFDVNMIFEYTSTWLSEKSLISFEL